MYVLIEENPNSAPEERVFATHGATRIVNKVNMTPPSKTAPEWCAVVAVGENGSFEPAQVVRVDDSADGTAWLVHGGAWGLRLKSTDSNEPWGLDNNNQWGVPFLVLDSSESSIDCEK